MSRLSKMKLLRVWHSIEHSWQHRHCMFVFTTLIFFKWQHHQILITSNIHCIHLSHKLFGVLLSFSLMSRFNFHHVLLLLLLFLFLLLLMSYFEVSLYDPKWYFLFQMTFYLLELFSMDVFSLHAVSWHSTMCFSSSLSPTHVPSFVFVRSQGNDREICQWWHQTIRFVHDTCHACLNVSNLTLISSSHQTYICRRRDSNICLSSCSTICRNKLWRLCERTLVLLRPIFQLFSFVFPSEQTRDLIRLTSCLCCFNVFDDNLAFLEFDAFVTTMFLTKKDKKWLSIVRRWLQMWHGVTMGRLFFVITRGSKSLTISLTNVTSNRRSNVFVSRSHNFFTFSTTKNKTIFPSNVSCFVFLWKLSMYFFKINQRGVI